MSLTKKDIVRRVLGEKSSKPRKQGSAFAPSNIALCKYWGKRNEELNLLVTPCLSLSLVKFVSWVSISLR
jgi:diphosphomevalonate decarboxylase